MEEIEFKKFIGGMVKLMKISNDSKDATEILLAFVASKSDEMNEEQKDQAKFIIYIGQNHPDLTKGLEQKISREECIEKMAHLWRFRTGLEHDMEMFRVLSKRFKGIKGEQVYDLVNNIIRFRETLKEKNISEDEMDALTDEYVDNLEAKYGKGE